MKYFLYKFNFNGNIVIKVKVNIIIYIPLQPETVPQACIDMTKVLEVTTAEDVTGHSNSIAVTAPDRVTFVKGTCSEESKWWLNILAAFPKSKGRHKRNATFPGTQATTILQTSHSTAGCITSSLGRFRHNSYHKDTLTSSHSTGALSSGHHLLQDSATISYTGLKTTTKTDGKSKIVDVNDNVVNVRGGKSYSSLRVWSNISTKSLKLTNSEILNDSSNLKTTFNRNSGMISNNKTALKGNRLISSKEGERKDGMVSSIERANKIIDKASEGGEMEEELQDDGVETGEDDDMAEMEESLDQGKQGKAEEVDDGVEAEEGEEVDETDSSVNRQKHNNNNKSGNSVVVKKVRSTNNIQNENNRNAVNELKSRGKCKLLLFYSIIKNIQLLACHCSFLINVWTF